MPIIKKFHIDNAIFKELNEKYPIEDAANGVKYKQKLEYITFETDFLSDPILRALTLQFGFAVIAVIFYLRTEMCKNGWKIRIDKGAFYNALINDCSYLCNLNRDMTHDIIQKLIEHKFMFMVQDEEVEAGEWLTCPQQVFNYEMACNNRQQSRKRQGKKRQEDAAQNNQTKALINEQEVNGKDEQDHFHPNAAPPGWNTPYDDDPFGLNTPE